MEAKAWVGAGDLCRSVLAGSISHLSWDMLFASLCCLALTCPGSLCSFMCGERSVYVSVQRGVCGEVFPVSVWWDDEVSLGCEAPLDAGTPCGDLEVRAWSLQPSNPVRGAGVATSPFNTWLDLL